MTQQQLVSSRSERGSGSMFHSCRRLQSCCIIQQEVEELRRVAAQLGDTRDTENETDAEEVKEAEEKTCKSVRRRRRTLSTSCLLASGAGPVCCLTAASAPTSIFHHVTAE